jgi:hypothetical protein
VVCHDEYHRPGGRQPGDRIVRCDLDLDHDCDHEETASGSTWPRRPTRTLHVTMTIGVDDRDGRAILSTRDGELGSLPREDFLALVAREFRVTITPATDGPAPAPSETGVPALLAELVEARAERDQASALAADRENEVDGMRTLIAMQWNRSMAATRRWRAEDPEARRLIMPDLGTLLTWLMHDADKVRAELADRRNTARAELHDEARAEMTRLASVADRWRKDLIKASDDRDRLAGELARATRNIETWERLDAGRAAALRRQHPVIAAAQVLTAGLEQAPERWTPAFNRLIAAVDEHNAAAAQAEADEADSVKLVNGRREMFDGAIEPGGWVCAEPGDGPGGRCGMPVESEPCTVHPAATDARMTDADEAALLARQRDAIIALCGEAEAAGRKRVRIADIYAAVLQDLADAR